MTPPAAAAASAVRSRPARAGAPRSKGAAARRSSLTGTRPPRRISGPARAGAAASPAPGALAGLSPAALARRALRLASLRSIQDLLAGRLGIALVAFALIGIVTLQLGLLKLNGGIGRAIEHEALLQRENAALSIENSEMAAGDHVELSAARAGMVYVPPGALRSLTAHPRSDAARAATVLRAPVSVGPLGEQASSTTLAASSSEGGSAASKVSTSSSEESASGASGQQTASPTGVEAQGASTPGASSASSAGEGSPTTGAPPATGPAPGSGQTEGSPAGGAAAAEGPAG